jgi:hypothetical protein
MLGVALANDSRHAVALDHLAVLADRLHAGANFHENLFGPSMQEKKQFLDRL